MKHRQKHWIDAQLRREWSGKTAAPSGTSGRRRFLRRSCQPPATAGMIASSSPSLTASPGFEVADVLVVEVDVDEAGAPGRCRTSFGDGGVFLARSSSDAWTVAPGPRPSPGFRCAAAWGWVSGLRIAMIISWLEFKLLGLRGMSRLLRLLLIRSASTELYGPRNDHAQSDQPKLRVHQRPRHRPPVKGRYPCRCPTTAANVAPTQAEDLPWTSLQ